MEIHLLGQKTNPAVTLNQGALVVINPMTVMTHTDVEHMETQMLKYKTAKHIRTNTTHCTTHTDAENVGACIY